MTVEKVKEYLKTINLNDYDLGNVEITDEDCQEIADDVNVNGKILTDAVEQYLYGIREILDAGLEDEEE